MSAMPAIRLQEHRYTIAEWEKLPEYPKTELFDGYPILMAPPTWDHQSVSHELERQLGNYLHKKQCVVRSNVGVQLDEQYPTVFIPDIIIVCDPKKIRPQGVVGAPDLIIEILSPSSGGFDKVEKLNQYLQNGVREYWIVDPTHKVVDVLQWEKGPATKIYTRENKILVGVLDECEIDLSLVFPESDEERLEHKSQPLE